MAIAGDRRVPFWDFNLDRIIQPGLFIVPISFIQENIRDVIVQNQERIFAYFNFSWASFFGHTLTRFDEKVIVVGNAETINTKSIRIYPAKKQEQQFSNHTQQPLSQLIEVITGNEQLTSTKASRYSVITANQNYTEAIASIFSPAFPRERLLKDFPVEQPLPVIDGSNITYEINGKKAQQPTLTLFTRIIESETISVDNKILARGQILLDIKVNVPTTQLSF